MNYAAADIEAFILLARKHGVSHLRLGDLEFTLGPAVVASIDPATKTTSAPTQALTPKCGCGHAKWDHRGDVGCIHGCPPSRCIPNPPDVKE